MKLWVKLFIGAAIIFIAVGIFLYLYPAYVLGRAVRASRDAAVAEIEGGFALRTQQEEEVLINRILDLKRHLGFWLYQFAQSDVSKPQNLWAGVEGLVALIPEAEIVELVGTGPYSMSVVLDVLPDAINSVPIVPGVNWIPGDYPQLALAMPMQIGEQGQVSSLGGVNFTAKGLQSYLYTILDGYASLRLQPAVAELLHNASALNQKLTELLKDPQLVQTWTEQLSHVEINMAAALKVAQANNIPFLTDAIKTILAHRDVLLALPHADALTSLWGGFPTPYGPLSRAIPIVAPTRFPVTWQTGPQPYVWLWTEGFTGALMEGMAWMWPEATSQERMEKTLGVAALIADGSGWHLPTSSVMTSEPILTPLTSEPPIPSMRWAPTLVDVVRPSGMEHYLVNTLIAQEKPTISFTVGIRVRDLLAEVAAMGDFICAVQTNNKWIYAIDSKLKEVPLDQLPVVQAGNNSEPSRGQGQSPGGPYSWTAVPLAQQGVVQLVMLWPRSVIFAPVYQLQTVTQGLTSQVRSQLAIAYLIALGVVLIIIYIVTHVVTKPLTLLTRASKPIAEGDYEGVSLPKTRRKDEIGQLVHAYERMIESLREKARVRDVLNKVVSPEVAAQILKTGGVALGGEQRDVTMLFADIRNFTGITEHLTPEQVIMLLNECMTRVSRVIERHGGIIDKFVGDEVIALFNAPTPHPQAAIAAVAAALEINDELKRWNVEREAKGLPAIHMGSGIHSGPVVAGNMGAEDRLNYTVIGAAVNLTSRLCSYAKADEVIISEATLQQGVADMFDVEKRPPVELKGFTAPIPVYRVIGPKK
jgi:class 3 adenylate cyclase